VRSAPALLLCACALALPSAALASTGGASPGDESQLDGGGVRYGAPVLEKETREPVKRSRRRVRRKRRRGRPILRAFDVRPASFYLYGRPALVRFRIDDRSRTVRVRLSVLAGGRKVTSIDLGDRPTGPLQTYALRGRETGVLPQGKLQLRLSARDRSGKRMRTAARASATDELSFHWHRFPLAGPFSYGGRDSRFGARRRGHRHQGQDLGAAEGTAVVAPRGGRISNVRYQAEGAGYYVVLEGFGEERSYVFMHLQRGSIQVREGDRVRTGQRLASVGNTGSSSGAHLHFEIWRGTWYGGGEPVDPLPYLKRWDSWS
jgi:murein DD-endopeptidase MepM/ murein hydrolase activator NlpD